MDQSNAAIVTPTESSSWKGQIYHVPDERIDQLQLLRLVPGLTEDEVYFLNGIVALCMSNIQRRTDQQTLWEYLKKQGKQISYETVKARALSLHKAGVFERSTENRPRTRPYVIFTLRDISDLVTSDTLAARQTLIEQPDIERLDKKLIITDPNEYLPGNEDFRHAYSRKMNNVILRRCSGDPSHLGKSVAITLPGYNETVHVVQRTASGIPPMDGSEDRLQQALLTMFKEHLRAVRLANPSITLKNEWLIDMREVVKTMKLRPSSGNMAVQAKRLYQLRHNTFEIHFDPSGMAAKKLNLTRGRLNELYEDKHDQVVRSLHREVIDQYFLSVLEPVRDEIVWSDNAGQMSLLTQGEREERQLPEHALENTVEGARICDRNGRLYRFYRISFHPIIFEECIDDALGQIHKQPPSLLKEDRVIARLLVYLAQRIFGKSRNHPFEATWGEIALEIQPAKKDSLALVFKGMTKVFQDDYIPLNKEDKWNPKSEPVVELHGYCFQTIIPPGLEKKRKSWKLRMWRYRDHEYTGDTGPAALARARELIRKAGTN